MKEIKTFMGIANYEKAIENNYITYRGEDLRKGGYNYKEVAERLLEKGYKVRVYEETTRVRGLHNYTILYK